MAVVNPHTTRATGTVLTAAIYNADHQNHITNANNVNVEAIAATAAIVILDSRTDAVETVNTTQNTNITALQGALNVSTWQFSGMVLVPQNQTYRITLNTPFGGIITETNTISTSGTATCQFQIGGVALGGANHAVSTSLSTIARASANVFLAGNNLMFLISANNLCLNMTWSVKYTRDLLP